MSDSRRPVLGNYIRTVLAVVIFTLCVQLHADQHASGNTQVIIQTNKGEITLELFAKEAPITTTNFLEYVKSGFYEGTIFHRVIPDFVIQGGGLTVDLEHKSTRSPITNEADNGIKNERGTIAMARTRNPHSATSQFFINLKGNAFLNHRSKTDSQWGYTVFARVRKGMDVVDVIASSPTGPKGGTHDVPLEPIIIHSARLLRPER